MQDEECQEGPGAEQDPAGDAHGFYAEIAQERDDRRFCGFPPVFTLLTLLKPTNGQLHRYDQSVDESQSVVTFCSLSFD